MISRKLSIVLVLIVLLSFAQAKDECPLQCDCSDDLSVVRCRGMDKFPVFGFSSKVKTLDVTYGNIKHIHEKDVKAYTSLENLFISHNPLDCDQATTYTLKHVLKETVGLKSFDGHKIKCERMMPLMPKETHDRFHVAVRLFSNRSQKTSKCGNGHRHYKLGGPHIHLYHGRTRYFSPLMVTGAIVITILGMLSVAGVCLIIVHYRHKLFSASEPSGSEAEDPVRKMEEGTDTSAQTLMEGLRKQRRGSQGFPENAIVDSENEDVVEQEEYLRDKMKKQRRLSQGYADGSGSSEEESVMVEINLNEDLCSSRK